jgi:hypothetical protein
LRAGCGPLPVARAAWSRPAPVNRANSLTAALGTRLAIAAVQEILMRRLLAALGLIAAAVLAPAAPVLRAGPAPDHTAACHFAFAGEPLGHPAGR